MAYDLLLRRLTRANWARRSTLPVVAPASPVSGWPRKSISCGVERSPRTVKGEIVNGRRVSIVGGPDDPLAQLPAKERKAVAQLIVLRKRADDGNASAQRIVEAVARLKIFVSPAGEPAKL